MNPDLLSETMLIGSAIVVVVAAEDPATTEAANFFEPWTNRWP